MTLIIGKRSNLSKEIFEQCDDCVLISSLDIETNIKHILDYCSSSGVNIIFNNFQASTMLNENTDFNSYIIKSVLNTSRILSFLIKNNILINKLIYTSSSSVYGNNKFCLETDQVKPMSLQGALKVANEELIKRFCKEYKINYTIARIFNMYGGDDTFSIISKIKDAYKNDKVLTVINGGKAIRDYIAIHDVVKTYKTLINDIERLPEILNIASGRGKRVIDFLNLLENEGFQLNINNINKDEISASIADTTLLNELINIENFSKEETFLMNEIKST